MIDRTVSLPLPRATLKRLYRLEMFSKLISQEVQYITTHRYKKKKNKTLKT